MHFGGRSSKSFRSARREAVCMWPRRLRHCVCSEWSPRADTHRREAVRLYPLGHLVRHVRTHTGEKHLPVPTRAAAMRLLRAVVLQFTTQFIRLDVSRLLVQFGTAQYKAAVL